MFARGEFALGAPTRCRCRASVVHRDGFSYVFVVEPNGRVAQARSTSGRRVGERIEVIDGLAADAQVVARGAGFLGDGDRVRVSGRCRRRSGRPRERA